MVTDVLVGKQAVQTMPMSQVWIMMEPLDNNHHLARIWEVMQSLAPTSPCPWAMFKLLKAGSPYLGKCGYTQQDIFRFKAAKGICMLAWLPLMMSKLLMARHAVSQGSDIHALVNTLAMVDKVNDEDMAMKRDWMEMPIGCPCCICTRPEDWDRSDVHYANVHCGQLARRLHEDGLKHVKPLDFDSDIEMAMDSDIEDPWPLGVVKKRRLAWEDLASSSDISDAEEALVKVTLEDKYLAAIDHFKGQVKVMKKKLAKFEKLYKVKRSSNVARDKRKLDSLPASGRARHTALVSWEAAVKERKRARILAMKQQAELEEEMAEMEADVEHKIQDKMAKTKAATGKAQAKTSAVATPKVQARTTAVATPKAKAKAKTTAVATPTAKAKSPALQRTMSTAVLPGF